MRIARTVADVRDLMTDHSVMPILNGKLIHLVMEPTDEWLADYTPLEQPLVGDGQIEATGDPINFKRITNNTIRRLIASPQFWRVTTVADQITRFYLLDGGEYGSNKPTRVHGMTKLEKKGGQPFTIHFDTESQAKAFIQQITDGKYHQLKVVLEDGHEKV